MIKGALLITTLWFTLSLAEKDVIIKIAGDHEQTFRKVEGLDDDATLLDALEKAQKDGQLT